MERIQNLLDIFHSLGEGDNLQESIKRIKEAGASQIDCVKILVSELKISILEADKLILNSIAWGENREDTEAFRDQFDTILGKTLNKNDCNK